MTPFPINFGWSPDYDTRVDNSNLLGWFVGESGLLYSSPQFNKKNDATNGLAMLESDNGIIFLVEKGQLVELHKNGTRVDRVNIKTGLLPIRMAENKKGEIFIVNGSEAYVFNKSTDILTLLSTSNGFTITNPVDVVVLNTIAVIVGGTDKEFTYSGANDGLTWTGSIINTDQATGKLTGISSLNNSLYIFGEFKVQKWVASIERTSYDAPFAKATGYTNEYGCLATASIISLNNTIYYLSSNGHVIMEQGSNATPITKSGQARYIYENSVILNVRGFYLEYLGHYFYGLNLGLSTLLYCDSSQKWSFLDDKILDGKGGGKVLMDDGVYLPGELASSRKNQLITKTLFEDQTINEVKLKVVQGRKITDDLRFVELSYSDNNLLFENVISERLSNPGDYQYELYWDMNVDVTQLTLRFSYYGDAPLTIIGCSIKNK